jgi:hypothetical protein
MEHSILFWIIVLVVLSVTAIYLSRLVFETPDKKQFPYVVTHTTGSEWRIHTQVDTMHPR